MILGKAIATIFSLICHFSLISITDQNFGLKLGDFKIFCKSVLIGLFYTPLKLGTGGCSAVVFLVSGFAWVAWVFCLGALGEFSRSSLVAFRVVLVVLANLVSQ